MRIGGATVQAAHVGPGDIQTRSLDLSELQPRLSRGGPVKARLRPDSALKRQLADHGRCYKCHLKPPCMHFSSLKQLEDQLAPASKAAGARESSLVEHGGDEAEDTKQHGRDRLDQPGGARDSQLTPHRPQMASPVGLTLDHEDKGAPLVQLKSHVSVKGKER